MCPYLNKGCKIQDKYINTILCQERYNNCAGYFYVNLKGNEGMPENALDWSVFLRKNS